MYQAWCHPIYLNPPLIYSSQQSYKMASILIFIYKWGNWGSERLSNLPQVTQSVNRRTGISIHLYLIPETTHRTSMPWLRVTKLDRDPQEERNTFYIVTQYISTCAHMPTQNKNKISQNKTYPYYVCYTLIVSILF